jgi:hypothetical protein
MSHKARRRPSWKRLRGSETYGLDCVEHIADVMIEEIETGTKLQIWI